MDDMGNTESGYFSAQEPVEQKLERIQEKNRIKAGKHAIKQIIKRLQERIAFYDSLDSIRVDIDTTPEEHLREVISNKKTGENLKQELAYFTSLLDSIE